jgi:putative transposase
MPNFRRYRISGGSYFFTLVTQDRRPILTDRSSRTFLRSAIQEQQKRRPFEITAIVLLPDHLHTIWALPPTDDDYSTRWKQIKEAFTEAYLAAGGVEATRSPSRVKHSERGVWQKRFWEHTIRDDDDFKRCLDYIHYNPVKHGYVSQAADYSWSTFGRYVELGEYDRAWGTSENAPAEVPGAEWE